MKWQLESLYSNIVWFLVEAPNYKRNIRGDGKLEFYVAKTIAKCYSLKLCFNYGKPFQQWSQSNLSCHSYLLQCISFMRFNNQTFSQQRTLCVLEDIRVRGDALRSCRQMTIYSLDMMQGYYHQSRSSSLLSSR